MHPRPANGNQHEADYVISYKSKRSSSSSFSNLSSTFSPFSFSLCLASARIYLLILQDGAHRTRGAMEYASPNSNSDQWFVLPPQLVHALLKLARQILLLRLRSSQSGPWVRCDLRAHLSMSDRWQKPLCLFPSIRRTWCVSLNARLSASIS